MTLLREPRRLGAFVLAPAALAVVLSSALLAACGGGTAQVSTFKPERLIVLGDESSVIESNGRKYTINDVRTTDAASQCLDLPIVAQHLASLYGFAFEQCNPKALVPKAFIRALVGAKVDDATTGLAQQIASAGALGATDLVSVMIGVNDIIELYERVQAGSLGSADAVAEVKRRGTHAAAQISAVLATGARAMVMTVPDLGLSPYAATANLSNPGASALLAQLSYEYNGTLRTSIQPNDGRQFGLVLADDIVAAMAKTPTSYLDGVAVTNVAACTTAALTDCVYTGDSTTNTLVSGATINSHLWAGDRLLGPAALSRIGIQAQSRAVNNPL